MNAENIRYTYGVEPEKCKVYERDGRECERGPVTITIPGIGGVCSYHGRNHAEYRNKREVQSWESRVRELENQGLTRSDAQAVVDAEDAKAVQS